MTFSDKLPENVGPGEKVYVVVDAVAYQVVNDDGSDFMSTTGMLLPDAVADVNHLLPVCDEALSKNSSESEISVAGLLDKVTVPVLELPKQRGELESKSGSKLMESGSVNATQTSEVANEPVMSQPRTVLAEIDDEFGHLASEVTNKSTVDDSQPSDSAKPATLVNSVLGLVRGKSPAVGAVPLERPRLPKFVIQARPRLPVLTSVTVRPVGPIVRPVMPAAVSTVSPVGPTVRPVTSTAVDSVSPVGPTGRPVISISTAVSTVSPLGPTVRPVTSTAVHSVSPVGPKVRPVSVISPSRASPTKQKTVTSVIRSTSALKVAKVVNQEPFVSAAKVTTKEIDTDDTVEKIAPVPVKSSRQRRITKRMITLQCYFNFIVCFMFYSHFGLLLLPAGSSQTFSCFFDSMHCISVLTLDLLTVHSFCFSSYCNNSVLLQP